MPNPIPFAHKHLHRYVSDAFLFFAAMPALLTACQTSPIDFELADSGDTATADSGTVYYVLDSDSQVVDWHYDTADGIGGPDESCYLSARKDGAVAWCDTPALHAQECDSFDSKCCCRTSCMPGICSQGSEAATPCKYFDVAEETGYCSLPADESPVFYPCIDSCIPRSECGDVQQDGSCLDTDAEMNGICLIYDMEDAPMRCQKSCQMTFCDRSHMCVPLFDSAGIFSHKGACVPVN